MSKFIDKLKRGASPRSQPIGFRPAETATTPPLLLGLHLPRPEVEMIEGNADALLIDIAEPETIDLAEIIKAAGETPVGCTLLATPTRECLQRLQGWGCDFWVFDPALMPLRLVESAPSGRVLKVDLSLPNEMLRALEHLEVDAILASPPTGRNLTLYDLAAYHRLASLVTRPLLTVVTADVESGELKALRDARIGGVLVSSASRDDLARIRRSIDSLPPAHRRAPKLEAVLPPLPGLPQQAEEEELEPE